ncbi:MAG: hypothetical protein RDU13_07565 [Elusimicrobiales bacterium]|jgi:hypothetical protein|nr:hypothetical protein [Elusimicrobiales bacterium]
MNYSAVKPSFISAAMLAAALSSGLSGCALPGGKASVAAPAGSNPPLVYAGARMQRGGGQVTAVTLRKADGNREKVSLRWTGGWDLPNKDTTFYREMVPPGKYRIHVVHFDSGGQTHIKEVGEHFRDFEVKPEGIQFIGEILVERNGSALSYRMGGAEVNRRAIAGRVLEHLRGTGWEPLLEKHREGIR